MKKVIICFIILVILINFIDAECIDPDVGWRQYIDKTTVIGTNGNCTDSCIGEVLVECICDDDKGVGINKTCESGCSEGVCLNKPEGTIQSTNNSTETTDCIDSDIGPNQLFEKGTTSNFKETKTDFCDYTDPNKKRIIEYACEENKTIKVIRTSCEIGCKEGACIKLDEKYIREENNLESDKEEEISLFKKIINWFKGLFESKNKSKENNLDQPVISTDSECIDSDIGSNQLFERGTTSNSKETKTDYCDNTDVNKKIVIEYACEEDNKNIQEIEINCEVLCKDGACIKPI